MRSGARGGAAVVAGERFGDDRGQLARRGLLRVVRGVDDEHVRPGQPAGELGGVVLGDEALRGPHEHDRRVDAGEVLPSGLPQDRSGGLGGGGVGRGERGGGETGEVVLPLGPAVLADAAVEEDAPLGVGAIPAEAEAQGVVDELVAGGEVG